MKRSIMLVCLTLLVGLGLTFTQVLAAPAGLTPVKKTPGTGGPGVELPEPPREDPKATKQAVKEERKQTQEAFKAEKAKGPQKTKTPGASDKEEKDKGKRMNFRGTISAVNGDSLQVTLKDGEVVTVSLDASTRIHFPGQGNSTTAQSLQPGMEVSVHAITPPQGGNPQAVSINAIPGKPEKVHRVGTVTAYVPGVSITVRGKDGQETTFAISDARLLPDTGAEIQVGETRVTIISPRDVTGGEPTARAIVVHKAKDE